jgi:CheY-like chemotaxis protein
MNFTGKVLIVDDEAHIRKFVSLLLRKIGNPTVFEAANGDEAIALYQKESPDLVLLDVNMPNLDGVQTLERLRKLDPDAIIVMLTSLANRRTVEDCVRLGATDYIRKDTPPADMAKQLAQIVQDCFGETPPTP